MFIVGFPILLAAALCYYTFWGVLGRCGMHIDTAIPWGVAGLLLTSLWLYVTFFA